MIRTLPDLPSLLPEIERCGWAAVAGETPFGTESRIQTGQGPLRFDGRVLRSERGESLAIADLGPAILAPRESLFPRFLDFGMETRLALAAARLVPDASRLLLAGGDVIRLYRLADETLECEAVASRDVDDALLPTLAARARGRGEGLRGEGGPVEVASALRGWIRHWGGTLAEPLGVEPDACEQFVWKLILMLQWRRKLEGTECVGGWGVVREKSDGGWSFAYDSLSTATDLAERMDDFERRVSTRIFSGDAELHREWIESLSDGSLLERLRAELLMQASGRFEPETVAWVFASMDREQEGWRREMSGAAGPFARRFAHEGWMVVDPLVCDLARHGFAAALRDADRLAELWDEYDRFRRRERERPDAERLDQPDLFFDPPRGVGPEGLRDGVDFLFSESLRLRGVSPREEFGTGIVFLLKALDWIAKYEWKTGAIDSLDRVWTA